MTPLEKSQKHLERMDAVVRAAEIKWGAPFRLVQLVPDDLAAKFDRQWQSLSSAITESRHEDVCLLADGVIRGVWALEKTAMATGHEPLTLASIGLRSLPAGQPQAEDTADGRSCSAPLPKAWFVAGGDSLDGI